MVAGSGSSGRDCNGWSFFQNTAARQPGCQIDYMVQTRFNTLYVCEVKFAKNPIGPRVIEEMEEKIRRMKVPKRFLIRPVLIHVMSYDWNYTLLDVLVPSRGSPRNLTLRGLNA